MLGPKILPVIFVALPAAMLLAAQTNIGEAAGDACRTAPGVSASRGMHWYYHTERGVGRRCWFLTSEGKYVRARHNVASTRLSQHKPAAVQVEAMPDHTALAYDQQAIARTVDVEVSTTVFPAPEQPVIDFVARWVELPKAVDVTARNVSPPSNGYADEHQTIDDEVEMPSGLLDDRDQSSEQWQTATTERFLAIGLGAALLLLCAQACKLGSMLHREAKRRRAGARFMKAKAAARTGQPQMSLNEVVRACRQANAHPYALQSFVPSGHRKAKSAVHRRSSQQADRRGQVHSVVKAGRRPGVTV
jgi:hypothetical protein